jgi:hypothetical protein
MNLSRSIFALAVVVSGLGVVVACAPDSSKAAEGDPQALTECNGTGTWALKIVTPVKYAGNPFVVPGTGKVTALVRVARTQSGTTITDVGKVCGIDAPDYQGTAVVGSEHYGTRIPAAAFESPSMPPFNLTLELSGTVPGSTFSAPSAAALIGATLPNPLTDAWPNISALVAVDADGDGKPGLSGDVATGPGFKNLPLNPQKTSRANRVYLAFRQVLTGATGSLKSCSRAEATATVSALNEHVVGCRREDGTDCAASEFKLLDGVAPKFDPTDKAAITTVRIPDGATCADVRTLDFDNVPDFADAGATSSDAAAAPSDAGATLPDAADPSGDASVESTGSDGGSADAATD